MQYGFGAYQLDGEGRVLFRGGAPVALPPKVAELLVALVQAAGTVVTREHLLERLWPDTVVEDGSLTSHISLLRKTLGRDSNGGEFIETLSKRGFANVLIIDGAEVDQNFALAARNIPNVDVLPVQGINVYDILRRDSLVLTKAAVDALEARFK